MAVAAPDAGSIRVLHLTDPHLFADLDGELRGTVTAESLQRVLDHYATADWSAQRVFVTGDLIQDDSAGAYRRFRDLLLPLKQRIHCVPGNHDVRSLMQDVCALPPFSYCAREQIGDWLLIGLDSCRPDSAGGEMAGAELERAAAAIAETGAAHVAIFLHHPPVPMGSRWLDSVGLANGEALLAMLAESGKVRLVAFGHVHQEYDAIVDGMRILATPSTCRQFAPGRDEFTLDDRPPAYRRLTLLSDGSIDTDVVWVD